MWRSTEPRDATAYRTRTSPTPSGHLVTWIRVDDDPPRYLAAGPDGAGNLLELVILDAPDATLVIHAMPLRRTTQDELFGTEDR